MNEVGNETNRRRASDKYIPANLLTNISLIIAVVSSGVTIYGKINELAERASVKNQNIYDRLTRIETKLDMHLKDKK